jgi:spore germination protein YaaH
MRRLHCFFSLALAFFFAAISAHAQQPKSLFYLTRNPDSVRSFLVHVDKIDILSPGWYSVDASGLVSGGPNPLVLEIARQHHVAVMPLVTNAGFVQEDVHKLLANASVHGILAEQLVRACKENGYVGFQLDFENVNWSDRDALSEIVLKLATQLHKENLEFSIATIPNAPRAPGETGFSAWLYQNWRGAFSLNVIAQYVDLICLMTYDQHTTWTVPGPVAGWAWTTANLD